MVFGGAFLAGSCVIFGVVGLLGVALRIDDLPIGWRVGLGGGSLLALAAVDVFARGRAIYCPLGWRRQTSRILMRRYPVPLVLSVWGFDTGLVITTFRVAAVSWGAISLTILGFAAWWVGIGYGLGFALPFSILLWRHRVGRAAASPIPTDPGLEPMLEKRAAIQAVSAAVLVASGGILLVAALL
jgi:hypothetical protein